MANSNLLYGTWQFNETIDYNVSHSITFNTLWGDKQTEYSLIYFYVGELCYRRYNTVTDAYDYIFPYNPSTGWVSENGRTIAITTLTNESALAWLQANAVKLSDSIEDLRTNKIIYNDLMNELSDVINNKAGTTGKKVLSQIVETAKTIETGVTPSGTKTITTNGTHDVTNYANANVNVPIPSDYIKPSGNLEIINNGDYDVTEKESVSVNVPSIGITPTGTKEITENNLYEVANYEYVNVNVPTGVTPTGTYQVTDNGEYDITEYAKVNVNVASSGGSENSLKKLLEGTDSASNLFYNRTLTDLSPYISYNDTENVSVLTYMYQNCRNITTIPLTNTKSAINMSGFCAGCNNLLTIPQLNTSNVESADYMFDACWKLIEVKLNTDKVKKIQYAFCNCKSLLKIDFSHYAISSTANCTQMCSNCYSLKTLIIRSFGTYYALRSNTFGNCYHLTGTVDATYNPNGDKDAYIYVPRSMVDTLKSATTWSTYADQIRALEDYTVDGTTTGELDESKI